MAIDKDTLQNLLKTAFPEALITITDLAGDGDHYGLEIADKAFAGKSRVQQHQLVYQALGGKMGGDLHALAIKTRAI
ncbi:MAG: BolA family transcriptional regulator [Alphaproteobacteria bacterium]|nr:BolA family transcriptional regulator [Alphaproteobacteria bacterium]